MKKIGIVIPTFDRREFLHEAIDSILVQTPPSDWEFHIVVVDDGSRDGTFEAVCQSFGQTSNNGRHAALTSRLTILRQDNAERGAARNTGAQWLKHNNPVGWLMFFDADDVMCANTLSAFAHRIVRDDSRRFGAIYAPIRVWRDGPPVMVLPESSIVGLEGDISCAILTRPILSLGATMMRMSAYESLKGFSEDRAMSGSEDWELLCRLALRVPVAYIAHVAVNYRQHPNNTSVTNYFQSLDLAVESVVPEVRAHFGAHQEWAVQKLRRRAALVKIGTVNSRGRWREALKLFKQTVAEDAPILLDRRAQRITLSIFKRAILDIREALAPRDK